MASRPPTSSKVGFRSGTLPAPNNRLTLTRWLAAELASFSLARNLSFVRPNAEGVVSSEVGVELSMKTLPYFLAALALILAATCQTASPQRTVSNGGSTSVRAPVLLELFTSEGCSSCPPADALLARLEEQQPVAGADIIALEEHVDYWDHQGWVDPFSSGQWTQRQQDYASGFGTHSVYTPELVVNGRSGFVGSHEGDAYRAVAGAAAQPRTAISVTLLKSEKRDHQH